MIHDFNYAWDMVRDLRATSSTNDKVEIIEDYCDHNTDEATFVRKILLYTYHPAWQYYVTSDNLKKKNSLRGKKYNNFFNLLDDLKNRVITGHDAIGAVHTFIDSYADKSNIEELIYCIIDKDLKTRAGDKIINKAIKDFIPEFSVALAEKYEPNIVNWKDGWYASRKIDGARCIVIVDESGETVFLSRTGKVFDTLGVIDDAIRSLGITGVVLDGELCLVDEDGNEDFQGVMKELRKKDHTIPNPSFKIFDMITTEEFYTKKGNSNRPYSIRYADLVGTMKYNECPCLSVLEQEFIHNDKHFQELVKEAADNEWEGVMLRADEPYKGKRSKDLLKVKKFFDDEYVVQSMSVGPFRYVKNGRECEEEMLSNITILHKGYEVDVGSGFTIEERQAFASNPKSIIGKTVTVQYFEETYNQDGGISLRFPTLKYIHGDKRDV